MQGAVKFRNVAHLVASSITAATPSKEFSILMNAPCGKNYNPTNNKRKK